MSTVTEDVRNVLANEESLRYEEEIRCARAPTRIVAAAIGHHDHKASPTTSTATSADLLALCTHYVRRAQPQSIPA